MLYAANIEPMEEKKEKLILFSGLPFMVALSVALVSFLRRVGGDSHMKGRGC